MYNKLKFIYRKTQSVFFFELLMIRLLSRHHPAANPSPPFPLCPAAGQRGRSGEGLAEAQLPHIFQDGVSPFAPGPNALASVGFVPGAKARSAPQSRGLASLVRVTWCSACSPHGSAGSTGRAEAVVGITCPKPAGRRCWVATAGDCTIELRLLNSISVPNLVSISQSFLEPEDPSRIKISGHGARSLYLT